MRQPPPKKKYRKYFLFDYGFFSSMKVFILLVIYFHRIDTYALSLFDFALALGAAKEPTIKKINENNFNMLLGQLTVFRVNSM